MHWPGYRYCGPGTDIKASDRKGGPVNKLDAICREHDINLSEHSQLDRETADKIFEEKAYQQGVLGNLFALAINFNAKIAKNPVIAPFLPGQKTRRRPRGGPGPDRQQRTPNKRFRPSYDLRSRYKHGKYPGLNPGQQQIPIMANNQGEPEMDTDGPGNQTDAVQGATGAGATGGTGGGGQVPTMNPRPIQTEESYLWDMWRQSTPVVATKKPMNTQWNGCNAVGARGGPAHDGFITL
ncbi:uncharacterized protein LOC129220505 [Uloborus diversus]|uniref:uncharacterized protein LOC129220505 n=1 Tax=Uloborus diversus TaxID=327109 RepID=UPI00240A6D9D|nr:uncharacterized protein LOC129220505 [Uloborus diversus]